MIYKRLLTLIRRKVDTSLSACIELFCGSSGSGKSSKVKEKIEIAFKQGVNRLIVFDPDDEYGTIKGIKTVRSAVDLIEILKKHTKKALKVRFVANGDKAFGVWCNCVFVWGNCIAIAEEIAGVTTPSKAPKHWHTLVSRGRKRGIWIYAVTQRPSESDKTILGNVSRIWCGRMARAKDRKYMADELDVYPSDLVDLMALEYLERDMMQNVVYRGSIKRGSSWMTTLSAYNAKKAGELPKRSKKDMVLKA